VIEGRVTDRGNVMTRSASALVAAAGLLLVAGLVGCGSSDGGTVATRSTSPSAPASTGATGPTGQAVFASMTTAMAKARTATVAFSSSVAGQRIEGTGGFRFAATDVAAAMTVTVPGLGKVRVILLPQAFYLRLPASAGLSSGKPWLKISTDAARNDPGSAAFGPLMDQLRQSFDPQGNLGILEATTNLKAAGTERVDGVPTTKYTATVDLAEAGDQYRALVGQGVTKLDYSIWVDRDDLPRKFSTVVPTPQGDVTASGTYRDWGKPVHIAAPPAGQVASGPAR
jgi:hypothetical protein